MSKNNFSNEIVIEPGLTEKNYWSDLWRYRELFFFLAWRDVAVRYKQTVVGVLWALMRPFLTMVVFTIIFGKLAGMPSGGVPYPILVFAGMLPWTLFAASFSGGAQSLVGNAGLISKVYFPRLIIPGTSVVVGVVEFLISLGMLALLMAWYLFVPHWQILLLPLFMVLALLAALGPALWIGALNVKYRDFTHVVPFVVQFGLYLSPVGFSSQAVKERFGETLFMLYSINPMVGVIDGFRWCIIGDSIAIDWRGFLISQAMVLLILYTGIQYFRKTEKTFADVI